MSDTAPAPEQESTGASRGDRTSQQSRGSPRGRGQGRGQAGRGNSRGGGRGRGRGDRSSNPPAAPLVLGNGPSEAAIAIKGKAAAPAEGEDGEVCMICASAIKFISIAPCNHRVCHICGLRMRALYKTKDCAYCRTSSDHVIFTAKPEKNFEDFTDTDVVKTDAVLGIKYDDPEIVEETTFLLHYNCPASDCVVACRGWPDLHRHVRGVHNKVLCDLCTRNKKVFTHEHELFTYPELRKHEKHGDDNPGASDQTGFKGHPECGFCKKRFYGDDELYAHCRDQHERCFLCDRRTEGRQPQYFLNYDALAEHFKNDHFPCQEEECLEKKFVVFDSDVDLKAHQLEAHASGLSKTERTAARRVDMANFNGGWQSDDRRGRGRGRGRQEEPREQPSEPAANLRRDELAYQRTMAVQSAQSVAPRRFGGRLTQEQPAAAASATRPATDFSTSYPTLGNLSLDDGPAPVPEPAAIPPQQRARQAAISDRVLALLDGDNAKFTTFKARLADYNNSKLSVNQLIDIFWSLLDTNANAVGDLLDKLPGLQDSKRRELIKAWNDWKAINEDYPTLPSSAAGASSGSDLPKYVSKIGGSKVLKLKNATKQSEQSTLNRQTSWGNAVESDPLPLPRSTPGPAAQWLPPASRVGDGKVTTTTWTRPSAAQRPEPIAAQPKPTSRGDFPALPPGKKPEMTLFGYGTGMVRRDFGKGTSASPWSNPSSSSNLAGAGDEYGGGSEGEGGGKKKKSNKKKQILFHMG